MLFYTSCYLHLELPEFKVRCNVVLARLATYELRGVHIYWTVKPVLGQFV